MAYFLSHTISYGLVYFQVVKKYHPPLKESESALILSKHMSVMRIITMLTTNIDKIVICHFLGPIAVASFTIAQVTTRYASGVLNSLTVIVLPKVSKQELHILHKTLPRKVAIFTLAMLMVALLYASIVPFLFSIIFPEYPESVFIAQLLAVLFVLAPSKIFSQALIAHNLLKAQYFITFLSPVIFITLLLILTPEYQLLGAAVSVVITSAFVAALNFLFFFYFSKSTKYRI